MGAWTGLGRAWGDLPKAATKSDKVRALQSKTASEKTNTERLTLFKSHNNVSLAHVAGRRGADRVYVEACRTSRERRTETPTYSPQALGAQCLHGHCHQLPPQTGSSLQGHPNPNPNSKLHLLQLYSPCDHRFTNAQASKPCLHASLRRLSARRKPSWRRIVTVPAHLDTLHTSLRAVPSPEARRGVSLTQSSTDDSTTTETALLCKLQIMEFEM